MRANSTSSNEYVPLPFTYQKTNEEKMTMKKYLYNNNNKNNKLEFMDKSKENKHPNRYESRMFDKQFNLP